MPGVEEGYPGNRCPIALADRGFDLPVVAGAEDRCERVTERDQLSLELLDFGIAAHRRWTLRVDGKQTGAG
ncbi:MAG: hypothetical protein R3C56_30030 [Pirellulaceae bacterium]